jgi:VIT1/CCC1 family predicted Fe2+/Mn2+ transporter
MNKHSMGIGISFGLTSAVITTLGLIVGLNSSTHLQATVLGGILIIAVADAFSDSLGIHISEEAEGVHTAREVWEATISTFLSKFVFAMTFAIPVLLLPLDTAIIADLVWGFFLLATFSYILAKRQNNNAFEVVSEHLITAVIVVAATYFIGNWINANFV